MLAIEVEFLTGRYVAAQHDDRDAAEWPPHPARLFSALVAEWGAAPEPAEAEATLLRELEKLGPPLLVAEEAQHRGTVTHYVPVNDTSLVGSKLWSRWEKAEQAHATLAEPGATARVRAKASRDLAKAKDVTSLITGTPTGQTAELLPEHRPKQARTFPSVTLTPGPDGRCTVTFQWPDAHLAGAERLALDGLLSRVTRLGHTSSLVTCRALATDGTEPSYRPAARMLATHRLRTVSEGQFEALVGEHHRHRGSSPRSLPSTITPYTIERLGAQKPPSAATSGTWVTYEAAPRLSGRALANLTGAVRAAIESSVSAEDSAAVHEVLVVGLPNVGHPHATGDLLGVAALIPRDSSRADRDAALRGIGRGLGDVAAVPVGATCVEVTRRTAPDLATLTRERWSGPATTWFTATPLVVAGHPARRLSNAGFNAWTAGWIAESCHRAGLPTPVDVAVSLDPLLAGARPVRAYPRVAHEGRVRRLVHARIAFPSPVLGPVLVGGGRHAGFGLLFPGKDDRA